MVRLIINAGDLDYAKINNDTIFELMDIKSITSATLMTNADGFEDTVKRLKIILNVPSDFIWTLWNFLLSPDLTS